MSALGRRRLIPHVSQSFNWDCGFACTEMVLRALGVPAPACSVHAMQNLVPSTSSIWTVDLAYVLHKFGVNFRYLTTTVGVDPSYKHQPFYKDTLDDDARRVNERFEQADEHAIRVEKRSLSSSDLSALVRPQDCMVMALVDRRYLYRPSPSVPKLIHGLYAQYVGGYIGHYILIAGYDSMRDGFYIYDPANAAEPHFVDARSLNLARRCHGTDEDLLVIPWQAPSLLWQTLGQGGGACDAAARTLGGREATSAAA